VAKLIQPEDVRILINKLINDHRIDFDDSLTLIYFTEGTKLLLKEREDNRIRLRQYENLRKHFQKLIDEVLGKDYYNEGMDTYRCDEFCCRDLKDKMCRRNCIFRRKNERDSLHRL